MTLLSLGKQFYPILIAKMPQGRRLHLERNSFEIRGGGVGAIMVLIILPFSPPCAIASSQSYIVAQGGG